MFYLVLYLYSPDTAPTNRVMAYVKALSEEGVKTRVVFFAPDKYHSRVKDHYPNIEFCYLWDRFYLDIPRVRRLFHRAYLHFFVNGLKKGDRIYVYSFPDLIVELSKRKDIIVFEERTEHNDASFICHIKKTTVPRFIEECRRIEGVIVISEGLRKYYIEHGCEDSRVHIVNMIVDSTRFNAIERKTVDPYIAYCGTASNNKDGVDQLIRSFSLVHKRHPNYKLLIIGNTPSKKQRFDNFALTEELGLNGCVVFTGPVSSTRIPQLLKNASVLALDRPDNLQAKFGFPTKLGEYLLTANPVVITKVGDIPKYLKDMESAVLVNPDNYFEFAERLCWAIEHPGEAKQIGENGKRVAEKNFNYLTETRKLLKIIGISQ